MVIARKMIDTQMNFFRCGLRGMSVQAERKPAK